MPREGEKGREREKSIPHQRCYKIESFKPIKPVLSGALMRGEEWRFHTSGCTLHLGCQITHTYPIGIRDENHRRSKDQQNVLLLQGPLFARHLENLTQVSPDYFSFLFSKSFSLLVKKEIIARHWIQGRKDISNSIWNDF